MNDKDDALIISNPRLLSAIYFGLLAVIANIFIDTILYSIGVQELLPFFQALALAAVIAAIFGALFGEKIVHSTKPYKKKVFLWAFLMVFTALPFHNLGFLYFFQDAHPHIFYNISYLELVEVYLLVLFYSIMLFGLWLAILAGLAAIYLRGYFVYHILNALYVRKKPSEQDEKVIKPKTAMHGPTTISTDKTDKTDRK